MGPEKKDTVVIDPYIMHTITHLKTLKKDLANSKNKLIEDQQRTIKNIKSEILRLEAQIEDQRKRISKHEKEISDIESGKKLEGIERELKHIIDGEISRIASQLENL